MDETVTFTTTQLLLARYKDVLELPSDYAVAKRLGVTPQAVQQWHAGRPMSNAMAVRLAQELELDVLPTIAALERDRAKSPAERQLWEKYCARVLVAALVALGAVTYFCEAHHEIATLATFANLPTYTLCVTLVLASLFIAAMQNSFRQRRMQWLRPPAPQ